MAYLDTAIKKGTLIFSGEYHVFWTEIIYN
jgi:hypothetical protein